MWYRYENGVIVGGPYNADQAFLVVERSEDHPDVVMFQRTIVQAALVPQPTVEERLAALEANVAAVASKTGVVTVQP